MMFKPRISQADVLRYQGGKMGIAAVPGSGKTHTLSRLAANLIASNTLADDQEVLIVTLVNSAVNNFSTRVAEFINEIGLLPNIGYRVRTLHGLAHDIIKERPDLVGLSNHFQIVEERESTNIIQGIAQNWLHLHPEFIQQYINQDVDYVKNHQVHKQWDEMMTSLAGNFIRQAKDLQLLPNDIRNLLQDWPEHFLLLEMGVEIYSDYQRALNYRAAVDFDDLIRLALKAITVDHDFLLRLQYRWPFILEDEAQDSSHLQEKILSTLTNQSNNWVRVGDTNQAIYETFTTANPKYLRDFLAEKGVMDKKLPESGRSTQSIIDLANYLIDWVNTKHPIPDLRSALLEPHIRPTPLDDPQPNPPDDPQGIRISTAKLEPSEEARLVVKDIKKWLPAHPNETVAVLVPRNERGAEVVDILKSYEIPYLELLRSSYSTRQIAEILALVLRSLAEPTSSQKLAAAFKSIYEHNSNSEQMESILRAAGIIRKCSNLEDYLFPLPGKEFLSVSAPENIAELVLEMLVSFKTLYQRWHMATLLPIDQLILSLSQDLFHDPIELALVHKLALILEQMREDHPEWNLPDFSEQLDTIARNERKFLGFSEEDTGFDPDTHSGEVVVATVHKAKGLEWDRVYLLSVNTYDYPSVQPQDSYISEKWFVRNRLNLEAELLDQLKALANKDPVDLQKPEGEATIQARLQYSAERLRLLFVGITRARKELIITWNTGRNGSCDMAIPLKALIKYREDLNAPAN
jgi:DNA helicase-2/ATP-dependent DNA helicase PcrA